MSSVEPASYGGRTATFADECDRIMQLADELPGLEHGVAVAHREARAASRDTLRSAPLDGGRPGSIVDDEGVPMPPVNDPTGEHVASMLSTDNSRDRHGRALRDAHRHVLDARRLLDAARGVLVAATATRDEDQAAGELGAAWCWNCARHHARHVHREGQLVVEGDRTGGVVLSATYAIGPATGDAGPARPRCRSCYDWSVEALQIRSGETPPPLWWGDAPVGSWPLERPALLVRLRDVLPYTRESDVRQALGR